MAAASLDALAVELVELIISLLDLPDISSLRLACRALEGKASWGRFRTFFRRKDIHLTTRSLENLVHITSHGRRLAFLLQDCTVMGVLEDWQDKVLPLDDFDHDLVPDSLLAADQDTDAIARQTALLTEAFRNIGKATTPQAPRGDGSDNRGAGLTSLRLRVAVREENGALVDAADFRRTFQPVWDTAQRTFHIVMDALADSQLAVGTCLDVFRTQKRCSLASGVFADVMRGKMAAAPTSLTPVFASLQHLTISLSIPHRRWWLRETGGADVPETRANGNRLFAERQAYYSMEALQTVLDLVAAGALPQLNTLDVHWLHMEFPRLPPEDDGDIGRPKQSSPPPPPSSAPGTPTTTTAAATATTRIRLDSCSLAGTFLTAEFLLRFLQTLQPSHVTLHYTHLPTGAYDAVFAYLADPASPVTSYDLDDIFVAGEYNQVHIHFFGPGKPKFRQVQAGGVATPTTLSRGPGEAKTAIRYEPSLGRPVGSGETRNWRAHIARLFGQPHP